VIMPSDWGVGAGVIACAEVATAKANPAAAINLIILILPIFTVGFLNLAVGSSKQQGIPYHKGQRINATTILNSA